jgi:SAM-dependent methyltransferase
MEEPASKPRAAEDLAAEAWAEVRAPLDRQLAPLGLRAIEALAPGPGEAIADIGCGAGQTVLQLAERVGPGGRVIGVDKAPQLLDLARERARGLGQVRFIHGDAARLDLPNECLDGVFSRFGVMAFADPDAAFANFRRMLRPAGRLAFVCWRALGDNELDWLPLQAAGLEALADPTPFSFEDPARVRAVLTGAGFADIEIAAHDEAVSSGGVEDMLGVLLRVGPLGRILREAPALREAAEPRVRAALAARAARAGDGESAAFGLQAATWIVGARA